MRQCSGMTPEEPRRCPRSGFRVCRVEARQAVRWECDPWRPRTDKGVELRANAGIAVERPKSDCHLVPFGPVPTEQARSAHRTEGLHASILWPECADEFLPRQEAEPGARNASLRSAEGA